MECNDYQMMASRLLDDEMVHEDSAALFAHLAACAGCREFHRRLLMLNASFGRIAGRQPEFIPSEYAFPRSSKGLQPQQWWNRRVSMRFPAFAALLGILAASIIFGTIQHNELREPESIYLTRLPVVIITAD